MSDSTSNSVSFPTNPADQRPLPEIVADIYGFKLAFADYEDGKRYYAVQDWIAGVAQTDNARRFWGDLQKRLRKAGLSEVYAQCVWLPYRVGGGRIYKMEYARTETLLHLTQHMAISTGIVSLIRTGQLYDTFRQKSGYVYLIGIEEIPGKYKIGITQDIGPRIYQLETVMPATFTVIHIFPSNHARQSEKALHARFKAKRLVGEWFALDADDIAYICNLHGD